jgi:uncharacterized protein (DUF885 family)
MAGHSEVAFNQAYMAWGYELQARIDIGVNYEGWTVDELEAYLDEWMMGSAAQEIYDTVTAEPCVYIPYGLGLSQFLNLRENAIGWNASREDTLDFHRLILEAGPVSFALLDTYL